MARGFLDGYKKYDASKGFGNKASWKQAFNQRMNRVDAEELLKGQPETPFSILGIKAGATPSEIKNAFRSLIMEWHPDRNSHRLAEAEEMSKKIIAAYTVLT